MTSSFSLWSQSLLANTCTVVASNAPSCAKVMVTADSHHSSIWFHLSEKLCPVLRTGTHLAWSKCDKEANIARAEWASKEKGSKKWAVRDSTSEVIEMGSTGELRMIWSDSGSNWIISGQEWKQGGQWGDHNPNKRHGGLDQGVSGGGDEKWLGFGYKRGCVRMMSRTIHNLACATVKKIVEQVLGRPVLL